MSKRTEIGEKDRQLHSIESKWINNEIKADTYQRWHIDLNRSLAILRDEVKDLSRHNEERYLLLKNEGRKFVGHGIGIYPCDNTSKTGTFKKGVR